MTTNPNTKYTDLTQSKRLKEIGFDAEADGYWSYGKFKEQVYFQTEKEFKSYRLDTLLLALPEWIVRARQYLYDFNGQMVPKEIEIKLTKIGMSKFITPLRASVIEIGPQAIAAAVDLICLLKEVEANKTD